MSCSRFHVHVFQFLFFYPEINSSINLSLTRRVWSCFAFAPRLDSTHFLRKKHSFDSTSSLNIPRPQPCRHVLQTLCDLRNPCTVDQDHSRYPSSLCPPGCQVSIFISHNINHFSQAQTASQQIPPAMSRVSVSTVALSSKPWLVTAVTTTMLP